MEQLNNNQRGSIPLL